MSIILNDMALLHPKFSFVARRLLKDLSDGYKSGRTKTRFECFETFRDVRRQADLLSKGVTKAGIYQSAHQLGLAVDFVPWIDAAEAAALSEATGERHWPGWSWHSSHEWEYLRNRAKTFSLAAPTYEDGHVEHSAAADMLHRLKVL